MRDTDLLEAAAYRTTKPRVRAKLRKTPMTRSALMRAYAGAARERILENWRVIDRTKEPDGPRKLRVGLRRLRTAVKLLGGEHVTRELKALRREARDLGRIVGRLRDADVLLEEIVAPTALAGETLMRRLHAHRKAARADVRDALDAKKWRSFKTAIANFETASARLERRWTKRSAQGLDAAAAAALDAAWREAADYGARLEALTIDERHEMRKALKTLRYGVELFRPHFGERAVGAYVGRMRRLQDVFGYLNDVALAETLPDVAATKKKTTRAEIAAIIAFHEARAEAAWRDAGALWADFSRQPKFWAA